MRQITQQIAHTMIQQIQEASDFISAQGVNAPEIGIVLGTGLGQLTEHIEIEVEINYSDIPHFPIATVESHSGKLVFGTLEGKKVLCMQGRFHYYEGYTMQQVTFPIRVMKALGVSRLLLSNASGAMNLDFKKGSLMLLDDHINLQPENPLVGENYDALGPRFPDMSAPYNAQLNSALENAAKAEGILLNKGVYVAVTGPNLETRAEYRFLKNIGADIVGMSTVPEVIVANHAGIPCACISVITDECDPENLAPVDIA
ncbi:MAG: purine-nucleoside phosphorylase, partial [Flavobacteriales bacterium]